MKLWKKVLAVVLLFVVIQTYIFVKSSDALFLDKSNPLTIEEVLSLSDNSGDITNIHIVCKDPGTFEDTWEMLFPNKKTKEKLNDGGTIGYSIGEIETFVKDDKIVKLSKDKNRTKEKGIYDEIIYNWEDIEAKESITLSINGKYGLHLKNDEIHVSWKSYFFDTEKNEENGEYFYLGQTKMNGRDTVVIKIYDSSVYTMRVYYIDKATGLIVKEKYKKSDMLMYTTRRTLEFEINTVTDNDVEKIDYKTRYPDFNVVEFEIEN